MKIELSNGFFISDIAPTDKQAYIEHFKEKQIYDQTLNIPFPYTEIDADRWILHNAEETKKQGQSVNWAIRRKDGYLVGAIGFIDIIVGKSHHAEIGYFLSKPYWGQNIMTEAVKSVAQFGFAQFNLIRITAKVFYFNIGSSRVLEKSGFRLEGLLRKHYKKDGKIFDGKLYGLLKENTAEPLLPVMSIPIGVVCSTRKTDRDDFWDAETSSICLNENQFTADALVGLDQFSHSEILFHMHQVSDTEIERGARYPRGNKKFGKVGIFAQRAKGRPNKLSLTICKIRQIVGLTLTVEGLDAIDGTPVLDIKPFVKEFGPRGKILQPKWISELMKDYWK